MENIVQVLSHDKIVRLKREAAIDKASSQRIIAYDMKARSKPIGIPEVKGLVYA